MRAALLAIALSLAAASARGAEPSPADLRDARDLFARAEKAEKAGDWTAALEKLRRVAQIKVTPGVRFHVAVAEEKTGQLVAALADFALAERQATEEKNRDVLTALKEPMAALQARVPRLVVRVPPDVNGLEITLDGKVLAPGLYAAEMPVDPKAHAVEARAPGRKAFARTVVLRERETTPVDVVLDVDGAPSVAPPIAPTPTPAVNAPSAPPMSRGEPTANAKDGTPTPRSGGRTLAIVATAGAVVLIGAGVGAYFVAEGRQSDGRAQCPTRPPGACDDLKRSVHTWDTLALAAWVGGAALATVAIIAWARPSGGGSTSGRLFVGPGSAGLAGTF